MEEAMEFLVFKIIMPGAIILTAVFVLSLPVIGFLCWEDSKKPEFSLRKDEWSCTKEYEYTTTTIVPAGKVMVPMSVPHHDCIQWSKH